MSAISPQDVGAGRAPVSGAVQSTMKAWVIREERHGEPAQAMRLEDVSIPDIGPDEVLIEVQAAGVNFNGAWICRGLPVPLSRLKAGFDFIITGSDAPGSWPGSARP